MRRSTTLFVMMLALMSFAGKNMKAYVSFDRNADIGAIKTFAYYETLETSFVDEAPHVHEMIKLLIIKRLQDSGMQQVKDNPDVFVTYHSDANQEMRMNVTMYHYHYGAGWWWSPLWGSGMDVSGYSRGTLIIDIWNPRTEELLWRGAVVGVVPDDPSPKKAQKVIEQALDKIGKEWRKQYKKAQKEGQSAQPPN
jgi:predicted heme/steroid binding protein